MRKKAKTAKAHKTTSRAKPARKTATPKLALKAPARRETAAAPPARTPEEMPRPSRVWPGLPPRWDAHR